MEVITSPTNSLIKRLNRLKQKKYREQDGEYFVEGYKNVLDTVKYAKDNVKLIVLSQSAHKKFAGDFSGYDISIVDDRIFSRVSETESAQGVLCINSVNAGAFPTNERIILLDEVRDPGNVGTILRSALAFGYGIVLNNCADVYSPKVTRSSMSAIARCNISFDIEAAELVKGGYTLIAADMGGQNLFSYKLPGGKYCIVIGNEANGISEKVKKHCSSALSVPMENIESLNAAVAASVMMCALRNQNN